MAGVMLTRRPTHQRRDRIRQSPVALRSPGHSITVVVLLITRPNLLTSVLRHLNRAPEGYEMHERAPKTQIMKASDARAQWSELLDRVTRRETRVLVEKSGVPVAAIVSATDLARLTQLEQEREQRLDAALGRMRTAFSDVPEEQLTEEVAAIIDARRSLQENPAASKTG
jgi:prevent-host-death family protein